MFAKDKYSGNARGGTELMKMGLEKRIDKDLLDNFQIFVSRVHEELSEKHVRILWLQDLAEDPENAHLKNGGWNKFHKLIFSSHWQMRGYIERYNIPWSKCVVLPNCITPIDITPELKKRDTIRMVYHTTPHRGLQILVPVFKKLKEDFPELTLDVYSSFKVYGWDDRDAPFKPLFDEIEKTEGITNHGAVSNEEIHEALKDKHIYSYPNIWMETSCISMMEAMSAGLVCVHPNFGALPETTANWTHMYQWHEDMNAHAGLFYNVLHNAIEELKAMDDEEYWNKIVTQKTYADIFYNWDSRAPQWRALLMSLKDEDRSLPKTSGQFFTYRS